MTSFIYTGGQKFRSIFENSFNGITGHLEPLFV